MGDIFIYTEFVRCGEIGTHAVKTFHKYHDLPLHIFCSEADLQYIPENKNNNIHLIDKNDMLYNAFDYGHEGTAILWTYIIKQIKPKKIVHFDSDVIFKGDLVADIIDKLKEHDIVGSRRCYKYNANNRDDIRYLNDTVNTYCFGCDVTRLYDLDFNLLKNWVKGYSVQMSHPVLDFFDPVCFYLYSKGATAHFIDYEIIGCFNELGSKKNSYATMNDGNGDCGDKIIHFAGVGSGRNFYLMKENNQPIRVAPSYVDFGLRQYHIYSSVIFNKAILSSTDSKTDEIIQLVKQTINYSA
jgi:hypothetical protein